MILRCTITYLRLGGPVAGARMRRSVIVFGDVVRCDSQSIGGEVVMPEKILAAGSLEKKQTIQNISGAYFQ